MALLTSNAFAKRLRQFMGPAAEDVPEKLATLGDGNTTVVPLDYAAHPVRLLATSPMERKWRARSCKKEPWTVAWIEESMSGGSQHDRTTHSGSREITEGVTGGLGTEVGGTRNLRQGTGHTGGDIGNRPE